MQQHNKNNNDRVEIAPGGFIHVHVKTGVFRIHASMVGAIMPRGNWGSALVLTSGDKILVDVSTAVVSTALEAVSGVQHGA